MARRRHSRFHHEGDYDEGRLSALEPESVVSRIFEVGERLLEKGKEGKASLARRGKTPPAKQEQAAPRVF